MMRLLVLAEHDRQILKPATAATVAAAVRIAKCGSSPAEIDVLVVGDGCAEIAAQAAQLDGVTRVRCCDAPHYADLGAENLAALLGPLAAEYSHLLAPASALGKSVLPRLAGLLDVPQLSEIVDVLAPDTFVRPIYAGSVLTTVRVPAGSSPILATVRTTAFEPATVAVAAAPVEALAAGPDLGLSRVIGRELNVSARPELTAASVVVAGGRGLASGENFRALLEPLADRLGGALGASRAAVDAGYVANDLQVGQTGKVVAPQLYIAVGISGAIQHLAGMKDSRVIVAINKDPEAPIFQVADYGLVGDLFTLVPELTAALG